MNFLDELTNFLGFGVKDDVGNGRKNREDDVQRVKGALREAGHFPEDREITGIIDRVTDAGINRFQHDHGLRVDGLIRPEGETARTLFRPKFKPDTRPLLHTPGELRNDDAGRGAFGESRDGGNRQHTGFDSLVTPGQAVMAPASGTVSKLGYPYADNTELRLVDIQTPEGYKVRTFYVDPSVEVGDRVQRGRTPIGIAQDLRKRFGPIMKPHIHLELRDNRNRALDPEPMIVRDE